MPFASKPSCSECKATSSSIWRKNQDGEVVCNSCQLAKHGGREGSEEAPVKSRSSREGGVGGITGSQYIGPIRKSARLKPSKYKYQPTVKPLATKGRSRRVVFKKNPIKAPASVATVVTSEYIFYEGQYWQVGDVVSVMDHDGGIYYAQLRGFLQDQYCQQSAVITWLLPTTQTTGPGFDPATYILGPEEDLPRTMDCFEFVCHAPSEYFRSKSGPYPTQSTKAEVGYISTPLEPPVVSRVPSHDEIYGLTEERTPHVTGRKERKKDKTKVEKKEKEVKGKVKENKRDNGVGRGREKIKNEPL